mmetsp:Transcript_4710/g.4410  ORF Transcript_4710/g.4410 Transcript_4710/m.4410 type:complete len:208 (-) Transcript_4710:40-663(-)
MFEKIATKLILEKGALNAVSLVLAHMTGADDIMQEKSLINGRRDYTTMTLKSNSRVENFHYVNNILKRVIPHEANFRFESVEIAKNRKVAYFDIPKDKVDIFFDLVERDQESEYHRYYQIEKTESLDKSALLMPYDRKKAQNRGFRGRSNNRGGNRRSNRNYNNRGGSYNRGGYNDQRENDYNRGGYNNRNDRDDYFDDNSGYKFDY